MLEDEQAIAIAANARQKNVAQSKRSSQDFDRIFRDFFSDHDFTGETTLDLGPGQFDFAKRVRERGGVTHAIDFDPAVVELGQHLGFDCVNADLRKFDASERQARYDGLFCKFSINAFWFRPRRAERLEKHIRGLNSLLKPDGWGWIAPWNGTKNSHRFDVHATLRRQRELFEDCGWQAYDLGESLATYYGVSGAVANHVLFVKNLPAPPGSSRMSAWLNWTRHRFTHFVLGRDKLATSERSTQ